MIKIGILSDTHGQLREELQSDLMTCDYLIHAGDIGESCYRKLKSLGVPLYAIRGNSDHGRWCDYLPDRLSFRIYGLTFFLIHNRSDLPAQLPDSQIIIFGHTHQYTMYEWLGKTFFNPGSAGGARLGTTSSYGILEVDSPEQFRFRFCQL